MLTSSFSPPSSRTRLVSSNTSPISLVPSKAISYPPKLLKTPSEPTFNSPAIKLPPSFPHEISSTSSQTNCSSCRTPSSSHALSLHQLRLSIHSRSRLTEVAVGLHGRPVDVGKFAARELVALSEGRRVPREGTSSVSGDERGVEINQGGV